MLSYSLLVLSFLWQIGIYPYHLYVLHILFLLLLLLCFLQFRSVFFFFPFFLGILSIFLICFFLGLYIVTTFRVTPFSFLYCKHCFTPSLFLLLLLWHFYGLITDLSFFFSWQKIDDIHAGTICSFAFLIDWWISAFFLNSTMSSSLWWHLRNEESSWSEQSESWKNISWVSRKSLKLLGGSLFFSSIICFLLFQ